MFAVTILPVVTGLIALACAVIFSLRALGYLAKKSYSAAQYGMSLGFCLGMMLGVALHEVNIWGTVGFLVGMILGTQTSCFLEIKPPLLIPRHRPHRRAGGESAWLDVAAP